MRVRIHLHLHVQMIAAKHTTGHIVQMYECRTLAERKGAHHTQGWFLCDNGERRPMGGAREAEPQHASAAMRGRQVITQARRASGLHLGYDVRANHRGRADGQLMKSRVASVG